MGEITEIMQKYAKDMIDGKIPVNKARIAAAKRFLKDLKNPKYKINERSVNFVIFLIENTFRHIKGSARGELFKLENWEKFIIYNLVGFELVDTGERRFKEAFIYIPRKNSKTFFASALAWALAMLEKDNYAVLYIIATKLDRAREAFDNILDNIRLMGEEKNFRILDNNSEHSISRRFGKNGAIKIQALAADAKRADGLNANIIILDEIHGYKSPNDYYVYKQAMKAYTNKLLIGITTAGADQNSFCYNRLQYCKDVVNGKVEDEQYFIFICEADNPEDYLNPHEHEIANPNYNVTIRPDDISSEAFQAQNDSTGRAEFLNKSLNIYVDTLDSYFNIDEFEKSDEIYNWSIEQLAELPIKWFGGADLSKLHDLTASCLYGHYNGVDIIISHAFFPKPEALRKANEDNIPLFGWKDSGWLTLSNNPVVEYQDVVNWFKGMREKGFKIKLIGFDHKFGQEFVPLMKNEGFKMVDTPQTYLIKSQGFRRIERQAKKKKLYYMHSEAYEYCVRNVKAIEKADDAIQFEKINPKKRIDIFDCSVFAAYQLESSLNKSEKFKKYIDSL